MQNDTQQRRERGKEYTDRGLTDSITENTVGHTGINAWGEGIRLSNSNPHRTKNPPTLGVGNVKERPVKKTRKDHKCFYCGRKIHKGESAAYHAWVYDHDFYSQYLCEFCNAHRNAIEKAQGTDRYEMIENQLAEHIYNIAEKCPKCDGPIRANEYDTVTGTVHLNCNGCDHEEVRELLAWVGVKIGGR